MPRAKSSASTSCSAPSSPEEKAKVRVDGFFDLETEAWDTFVCGGLYIPSERRFWHSFDPVEFFDRLLEINGQVWAWNGGLYDFNWFLEECRKRGIETQCSPAGTRTTRIEVVGRGLVLRDAVALIPMSLAKGSTIVGPEISKDTGLHCNCVIPGSEAKRAGEQCGGYCRIRVDGMRDEERKALISYLEIDCITGADAVAEVVRFSAEQNYVLKGTVGSSAYATAKHRLGIADAAWPSPQHYYLARKGYFGGRVTVARRHADRGHRQDINSAYPDALSRIPVPFGECWPASMDIARRCYQKGMEGIYRARVFVPLDTWLPPLPYRAKGGRVVYPTGQIWGHWTRIELAYAEECGCQVEILCGLVWLGTAVPFADMMAELFETRTEVGKSGGMGRWLKFVLNSFTGKLAQDPEAERLVLCPRVDSIRACPADETCGGPPDWSCSGRCRKWTSVDPQEALWSAPFWRLPECGHVHWAAYLTAATRIKWHRAALALGWALVYGDTDSIYSLERMRADMIGTALGTWAYEGTFADFAAIGPKAYRYTDEEGEVECRCKGLEDMTPAQWEAFRDGETIVRERGVMGLKSAARSGGSLFQRKRITRTNNQDGVWFGDRYGGQGSDPRTYPATLDQLRAAGRIN